MRFKLISPLMIGKISNILIYPIKSCAGIELESAMMTRRGLETSFSNPLKDREYMLVDGVPENGGPHHKFLTQRDRGLQRMALITPRINDGRLQIAFGNQDWVDISETQSGREIRVRVHRYLTTGVDQGDVVAKMLSDYLGRSVRLVRASGSFHRSASQNYLRNDNTLNYQDAYSISWLFSESVHELKSYLGRDISFLNFRPNIVASGGSPNLEHAFFHVKFGPVEAVQPKPGTRCMIINVDPDTGVMATGKKPLALQVVFDHFCWIDNTGRAQAVFAENALPTGEGALKISDDIWGLSVREPALSFGAKRKVIPTTLS